MIFLTGKPAEAPREGGCSVEACDGAVDTRGMCSKHYRRWLRNGSTDLRRQVIDTCSSEGCGRKPEARGLCQSHYTRWQRHQDPMVRLIKGCAYPGCLARVAVGRFCSEHNERNLAGRKAIATAATPVN